MARIALAGALLVALTGCTQPVQRTDAAPRREHTVLDGDPFQHLVVRQGNWSGKGPVHVYLEGDGLPWVTRTSIARDPTPKTALALHLMALDPGPAIYLGRPCYHGLAESPGCSPWLWTHGRYSEAVVRSMSAALCHALGSDLDREITLIGYSGGGVLAMLIAPRVEQVRVVLTIAANLDTAAWAASQGYSPLTGSLNPASQPPLPARIRQIHLTGQRDLQVPPSLSTAVVARQPNARLLIASGFDHRCCWERAWPVILAGLDRRAFNPDPLALPLQPALPDPGR